MQCHSCGATQRRNNAPKPCDRVHLTRGLVDMGLVASGEIRMHYNNGALSGGEKAVKPECLVATAVVDERCTGDLATISTCSGSELALSPECQAESQRRCFYFGGKALSISRCVPVDPHDTIISGIEIAIVHG